MHILTNCAYIKWFLPKISLQIHFKSMSSWIDGDSVRCHVSFWAKWKPQPNTSGHLEIATKSHLKGRATQWVWSLSLNRWFDPVVDWWSGGLKNFGYVAKDASLPSFGSWREYHWNATWNSTPSCLNLFGLFGYKHLYQCGLWNPTLYSFGWVR